ncbi:hypothetical protein CKAH01_01221 [Colletotrichum kahawae]|uniref:Uncharacterized protein n=1 Tax=Colletotrichum kahawae TaxID=34407 RepID=A0AAD9YB32_COLKA|nr:hypothetical protein CKAH01_01221 [Colletotrichum kahawae]
MVMVVHPSFINAVQSGPAHGDWSRREGGRDGQAERAMEANKDLLPLATKVGTNWKCSGAPAHSGQGGKVRRFHGHPGFQVINGRNNTRSTISPLQDTDSSIHRTRPRRRHWTGIGNAEWKPTAVDIGKAQQVDTDGWHLAFLPPGPPQRLRWNTAPQHAAMCGRANRNMRNLWTGEPVVP